MKTKSKLLLVVTLMLLTLTAATIINVSLNFRKYSIDSAVDKANMSATLVKDGLTAHMVNGMMENRGYFLEQIAKNDEIRSLWIARAQSVVDQYGQEYPSELGRDEIDKEVLKTGIAQQKVIENAESTILRVTIPYKADGQATNLNCLQCHNVQRGDTLGIISLEYDISHMRYAGLMTILKILGINLIFLIIVLILTNKYSTPYMNFFVGLQEGIKKASRGDFTHVFTCSIAGEGQSVISQLNTLFSKMQATFGDIKYTLGTFIPQGQVSTADPLYEAKSIIGELSDIYKFKKTIEHDSDKNLVFTRIADILRIKYQIKCFNIFEVNNKTSQRNLIHSHNCESICLPDVDNEAGLCRAYKTNTDVISTEFVNLCQSCNDQGLHYICIPFNINVDYSIVISITTDSEEELNEINTNIVNIRNYLEAAKPVVESRILMDKLRDTSLRDGMTGLYNRRFLEDFIDKVMSQAHRSKDTYSVMMLDVDWFKSVNDTYGHDMGDKVIIEIGKTIVDNIREADLAIRYGGEEFVVMLHNANDKGTMDVANKIHKAFADIVFDVGSGETMQKTMSIGIAKFPVDGDTIWQCIKRADTALYKAKTTGRNKIVVYEEGMADSDDVR